MRAKRPMRDDPLSSDPVPPDPLPRDAMPSDSAPSRRLPPAPLTPRAALRWPLIRRAMRQTRPARTLEIGCGQGAMGARLAGWTGAYTAMEPDPESYAVARARIEPRGGEVINGLSTELPADRLFDMVCAFEVLEHIEDDAAALAEWLTHLRPGGHLLLSVPAFQHLFGPSDTAVGHFRRYAPDELSDLLRQADLEPQWVRLYGWPLGTALEFVRNRLADRSPQSEDSVADRTAHSGRWLQPSKRISEVAIGVGVLPFRGLQRLVRSKGNGIVALARKP